MGSKLSIPNSESINFLLYGNPSNKYELTQLFLDDNDCLNGSSFVATRDTKVLIHGFNSNAFAEFPTNVKNAYLENKHKNDLNVLCVNWSKLCTHGNTSRKVDTNEMLLNLQTAADYVSEFLSWLVKTKNLNLTKVHLVGHNLGAHICGLVGNNLQSAGKKLGRITVLEPCSSIPVGDEIKCRKLVNTDADFVDVYTTSPLGSEDGFSQLGHTDFYIQLGPDSKDLSAPYQDAETHRFFSKTILDGPEKAYVANKYPEKKGDRAGTSFSLTLGEYSVLGDAMAQYKIDLRDAEYTLTKCDFKNKLTNPLSIDFLLYSTPSNTNKCSQLILHNSESIQKSLFNARKETKVIIHGFSSQVYNEFPRNVKDAYLEKHKNEFNVICVSWGQHSGESIPDYDSRVLNFSGTLATCLTNFLNWLVETTELDLSKVHLIGHSLGAHVSGLVGNKLQFQVGALGRISGLDPAGEGYGESDQYRKLQKADAHFVDVYHTSRFLGSSDELGDVDFFIKEESLPVDKNKSSIGQITDNHSAAHKIFTQSILGKPEEYDVTCQVVDSEGGCASSAAVVSSMEPIILGEYCKLGPRTAGRLDIEYPFSKQPAVPDTDKGEHSQKITVKREPNKIHLEKVQPDKKNLAKRQPSKKYVAKCEPSTKETDEDEPSKKIVKPNDQPDGPE